MQDSNTFKLTETLLQPRTWTFGIRSCTGRCWTLRLSEATPPPAIWSPAARLPPLYSQSSCRRICPHACPWGTAGPAPCVLKPWRQMPAQAGRPLRPGDAQLSDPLRPVLPWPLPLSFGLLISPTCDLSPVSFCPRWVRVRSVGPGLGVLAGRAASAFPHRL